MSVNRLAKYQTADPFTRIPNTAIHDSALDLKALGLLTFMLSKPDGWRFTERNLADQVGVGRGQLRTAMGSLIDAGYVTRHREHDGDRPITVTKVYDVSQSSQGSVSEPRDPYPTSQGSVSEPSETGPGSNNGGVVTNEEPLSDATATDVEVPDTARTLTRRLAVAVKANGFKVPDRGTKANREWLTAMDRLLRIDKADPAQVEQVIGWATTDSFWRANIRSATKFREQYPALRLRWMEKSGDGNGGHAWNDPLAPARYDADGNALGVM